MLVQREVEYFPEQAFFVFANVKEPSVDRIADERMLIE